MMTHVRCPVCHVLIPKASTAGVDPLCPLCHSWILAIAGSDDVLYISQSHQV
jgi:phage FluMu protein Com